MAERNMSPNKTPIPEQDPQVRNKNFDEVALGYTEEMAVSEAARCLQCKNRPCVAGCPVNVQIPEFINLIANRDFAGAYKKIKETNSFPLFAAEFVLKKHNAKPNASAALKVTV